MKVLLAGVRGTATAADRAHAEFGGDTTCFLIRGQDGAALVVDGGSGLRSVEAELRQPGNVKRALILMTHYHLDHLIGLPPCTLLYKRDWSIEIASPPREGRAPGDVIPRLFEQPFWPVPFAQAGSAVRFTTLPEQPAAPHSYGGLQYRWCAVHHPGGCTAYRFDEPATGRSAVIATDIEWGASSSEEQSAFERLCAEPRPPDLLIWDGQYTPAEYERHRGWGHSRWTDGVDVARRVGAAQLVIVHHTPERSDGALAAIEGKVRAAMPRAALGRQGSVWE